MSPGIHQRDVVVRENARERFRVMSLYDCAFLWEEWWIRFDGRGGRGHATDRGVRNWIYGSVWIVKQIAQPGSCNTEVGQFDVHLTIVQAFSMPMAYSLALPQVPR